MGTYKMWVKLKMVNQSDRWGNIYNANLLGEFNITVLKIIIRGDRNVGKTCLFHRLQGEKFKEEYVASDEIQVASIQWNYNATDDVVKVEIWDIVDKGKRKDPTKPNSLSTKSKDTARLKVSNNRQPEPSNSETADENQLDSRPALDAEFVDVYKGTNGVVFIFDMTKAWTFEYVKREIRRCPLHIPILILANHRDMGHHRAITMEQVQGLIEEVLAEDATNGRQRIGQIRQAECSMRNSFGLRYLYKFFNLPYLHLQRETLLKQLDRNLIEIRASCQELDILADSEEHNYDLFLDMITNKRRKAADQLSAVPKMDDSGAVIPIPAPVTSIPKSTSVPSNMATALGTIRNLTNGTTQGEMNQQQSQNKPTPSIIIGAKHPLPPKFQVQIQQNSKSTIPKSNTVNSLVPSTSNFSSVKNIDDFIPEESDQFRKFLDEPNLQLSNSDSLDDYGLPINDDSDDDSVNNNPMVAKYQEELDPEDLTFTPLDNQSLTNDISNYNEKTDGLTLEISSEHLSLEESPIQTITSTTAPPIIGTHLPDVVVIEPTTRECLTPNPHEVEDEIEVIEIKQSETPIITTELNCDDIDALESLYISNQQNKLSTITNKGDSLEQISSTLSSQNKTTKKSKTNKSESSNKLKSKKSKSVEDNVEQESKQKAKTQISTKLKTSNTNNNKKSKKKKSMKEKQIEDENDSEADRILLEEFLGGPINVSSSNPINLDPSSYETF
ncbi:hypothetical protein RDWZM_001020 [Blomia tropicalis]|uniref:Rab-like protein 6 n=1 Tax=Blomia tropicalis TaxID=40697 RepID=A0A9Q0RQC3_BLOTA|nr:hypothetical protein RDWZM_001020 [Blomia tropicalis]